MIYENGLGILRKIIGRYTNCKHYIAVDLISKHNRKGFRLGRVRYIINQLVTKHTLWRHMKRCDDRLHYDKKFKIFIISIRYINVNKSVFFIKNLLFMNKKLQCIELSQLFNWLSFHLNTLQFIVILWHMTYLDCIQ